MEMKERFHTPQFYVIKYIYIVLFYCLLDDP